MKIKELFVESKRSPLGIDHRAPALSWSFDIGTERSRMQASYRIIVSVDKQSLQNNKGEVWDTGKVISRRNVGIRFEGASLLSRQRYYWKVIIGDQQGRIHESDISWWEMGLLHAADWSGQWIGHSDDPEEARNQPMPLLRREFRVDKPIREARIYISGLGHYELRLNGYEVTDSVLNPGWTNYDKACLYNAYDVTPLLRTGKNAIGVLLGNGFFNVTGGRYAKFKDSFGLPKCIAQLEIRHADGTSTVVCSDKQWMTSASPLAFSCVYGGEDYDALNEQPGWDLPHFSLRSSWSPAKEVEPPQGSLKAQKNPPLKVMKILKPVSIKHLGPGVCVVDFGQNFSGWVHISVDGLRQTPVKMRPAELVNEDGTVNQNVSGTPYEWNYRLKGEGTELWHPRFSYYGFRYVQIEGVVPEASEPSGEELARLLDIEGQVIYPDMETTGRFECSDPMVNRIHEIINWAILSNAKSVLTDCPHREKLGWLEQVHLMGPSMLFNYSMESLLAKVMEDIQDAQRPDGMIPTTAPEYVVFEEPWGIFRHSVPWGATYILVPWLMYQKYGNKNVLIDHFEGMKRYIRYVTDASDNYMVKDGLGDWFDVGENAPGFAQNTPVALAETAMFYHMVEVIRQISDALGRTEEREAYAELANRIKYRYNASFFHPATGHYGSNSQTSNAISLALGLVDEAHRSKVADHFIQDLAARGYHTTAGDIGHRYVLLALAMHGRSDIIFEMSQQTNHPSYGYQIEHGATSLTEAWDGPTVGNSQNHLMLGHIEEWFYKGLAGLDYAFDPAIESYHVTIKPYMEPRVQHVSARQELLTGHIHTGWRRLNDLELELTACIPTNCSATLYIPSSSVEHIKENGQPVLASSDIRFDRYDEGYAVLYVNSGSYQFRWRNDSPCISSLI